MNYQDITFTELSKEALEQLRKGCFMTTRVKDKVNTMTIAWGGINIVWNKPLFVAYVRYTRDTYEMLNNTDEFTINIPLTREMKSELAFCGTKSGRDYDKIKECNLNLLPGRKVDTPVIVECDLHFECKVIYKQAMEPANVTKDISNKYYTNNDYHVIFYGEIVDSYILKGDS